MLGKVKKEDKEERVAEGEIYTTIKLRIIESKESKQNPHQEDGKKEKKGVLNNTLKLDKEVTC